MGRLGDDGGIHIKNRLPPVDLDLEIKRNAQDLIEILNLSDKTRRLEDKS